MPAESRKIEALSLDPRKTCCPKNTSLMFDHFKPEITSGDWQQSLESRPLLALLIVPMMKKVTGDLLLFISVEGVTDGWPEYKAREWKDVGGKRRWIGGWLATFWRGVGCANVSYSNDLWQPHICYINLNWLKAQYTFLHNSGWHSVLGVSGYGGNARKSLLKVSESKR